MSIGGRFHSVRALILGSLRKDEKTRVFGRRLNADLVTKVHLFLLQILHGNTVFAAMSRLLRFKVFRGRVLQGADLPLTLFEILFCQDCNAINLEIHGTGFWKGHRNWVVDGFLFCIKETQSFTLCW